MLPYGALGPRLERGLKGLLCRFRSIGGEKASAGLSVSHKLKLIRHSNGKSSMPTFERTIEIAASPETVWKIAADPTLLPKILPDVISVTAEPPGMEHVGQKVTLTAKIAGRRVQQRTETTEVVPNKKIVRKALPGGLMKTAVNTLTFEPTKNGTRATTKVEYEASAGYLGKFLSVLVVNRFVKKNLEVSGKNLKELAELKELPGTSTG